MSLYQVETATQVPHSKGTVSNASKTSSISTIPVNPTPQGSIINFDLKTTNSTPSFNEVSSKPFNRFILNSHQKKSGANQKLIDEINQTKPTKTIACQRCRRLRKKCSKHFPQCSTCIKMGEECQYADKSPTVKRRRKSSVNETDKPSVKHNNSSISSTNSSNSSNSSKAPILPPLAQNSIGFQINANNNLSQDGQPQNTVNSNPNQQDNYSYQDSRSTSKSISIPVLTPSTSIRLPSISINQKIQSQTDSPIQKQLASQAQRSQSQSNDGSNNPAKKNTEIQNAILSTLINLGKENLIPATSNAVEPLMIQREHALKYIESYFKSFYEEYPFIHKGEFYKNFDSINLFNVLNPTYTQIPLPTLKKNLQVYLILTIGFKNLHNKNQLSIHEIQSYSKIFNNQTVQNFIQQTLTFGTIDDIKIMTLLVIDSFFARNCVSTTNLTNILIGAAIRSNLHRRLNKPSSDNYSRFEIEMRYRLFWSIYIIDRTVSVYLNKLIGIPDEVINLPYTIRLDEYDNLDDKVCVDFKQNIELKRIEGNIFREVHSVTAINSNPTEKNDIILKNLRSSIESWYLKATSNLISSQSFDNSTSLWHTTRYYHCLTLLYRHSYLNPLLSPDLLDKLAKAVLQNLSYSYNLTVNKNCFSLNWMSFFRILVIFKTLLKCFVSGSIILYDARTELNLCIELLKNYLNDNEDWSFIHEIIEIFQGLLKLSFIESEIESETLIDILKESETKLTAVLKSHSVGCRLDDRIEDEYNLEERIEAEYYNLKN